MQRYQLVPVSEPSFNQQIYEHHGANRGRSTSDSPESGNIAIPNNGTIYVTSQQGNAGENVNGVRYSVPSEVRFDDEAYATARYEYQNGQHHPNAHNAHSGSGDDIKIELIRNQHALHGKVYSNLLTTIAYYNSIVSWNRKKNTNNS